jgi:hypothetical protein
MPTPITISFRDQTTGRISDLLSDEGLLCARSQSLLASLAGVLPSYQDEGKSFSPDILFCARIGDVLRAIPSAIFYEIGELPLEVTSGARILKECAQLSSANWAIYVERRDELTLAYGVFTYSRLPTTLPLHDALTLSPNIFALLMRRRSADTVEMRGARGNILSLIFSTVRESPSQIDPIGSFSVDCCIGANASVDHGVFLTYFSRLLEAVLTSSHGTMLVCGDHADMTTVTELQDAKSINPPLDFLSSFSQFRVSNTAESLLNLQRSEELLSGLVRCDGIVVFNTVAQVIAYRVFYRGVGVAATIPPIVTGGARRRAFEGVKTLVGTGLQSVLFRSQDGLTLYHGAT